VKRNGSDVLVDCLVAWGVDTIFGLPGDGINGVMEAIRKRNGAAPPVEGGPEAVDARFPLRHCLAGGDRGRHDCRCLVPLPLQGIRKRGA